jgi:hypothetical protein
MTQLRLTDFDFHLPEDRIACVRRVRATVRACCR